MSEPEPQDDRPDKVVHVTDDLEEYVERKRYDAIFDAKEEARQGISVANRYLASENPMPNNLDRQHLRERTANRVVEFLSEIRQILRRSEQGQQLAAQKHLGTVSLLRTTSQCDGEPHTVQTHSGLEPVEEHGQFYYILEGTNDYQDLARTNATVTYITESKRRGGGKNLESATINPQPPIEITQSVYSESTDLLSTVGLDLELGESQSDEWEL